MVQGKIFLVPYIVKPQNKKFFVMKKIAKIKKQPHARKGYVSTYNFEILNSFNPELQLKNTEF